MLRSRSLFSSLTVRISLLLFLALASVLGMAALLWFFWSHTTGMPQLFDELGKQRMLSMEMVATAHNYDDDPEAARQKLRESSADFEQTLRQLEAEQRQHRPASPNLEELTAETSAVWNRTRPAVDTLVERDHPDSRISEARTRLIEQGPILAERSDAIVQDLRREAEASERRIWWTVTGVVLFNVGLVLAGWLLSRRWLVRPIDRLESVARTLGSGDLDSRIPTRHDRESRNLQETFDTMAGEIESLVESLQRQRQLAESVLAHAPAGVVVHLDGDVIFANLDFLTAAGIDDPDGIGEIIESFAPEDRTDVQGLMEGREDCCGTTTSCQPVDLETDGRLRTVEIVSVPIDYGDDQALLSVFRDITDRRMLTARMMQMDRVAAIGSLASGMGHEINNPLSFVLNNIQFVLRRLDDDFADHNIDSDLETIREALSEARQGAEQIRDIVARLRVFTHFEETRSRMLVDIEATLDAALQLTDGQLRDRAELTLHIDDDLPSAQGDGAKLAQVFVNLLVNAADAVEESETGDDKISVMASASDDQLIVEIADTGCGIPEEIIDRIYDPFFTTKSPREGTGLGLAACQDIVESHGGVITFETEPGEGTVFEVRLPTTGSATSSPAQSDSGPPTKKAVEGRHIAVVDRGAIDHLVTRVFGDATIESFDSATEFLGALNENTDYDLVFCSLSMPDLTAMELYPILRDDYPDITRRLVFTNGSDTPLELEEFARQISSPVLNKPLGETELEKLVERLAPVG